MKKLRNVVYKSENLIVQCIQKCSNPYCTAVIIGSGHSVSVDDSNNITFSDPGFRPPNKIKGYGDDCDLFTVYFPKTCNGLYVAGQELAEFINKDFQSYKRIILHGHSKCGCCFLNLTQWLDELKLPRTHIVSVSAPLKGTPIADIQNFSKNLNAIEKFIYLKIFSDHKVDRDICPRSEFLRNIDFPNYKSHVHYIVSKCDGSRNLVDLVLQLIGILTGIGGDGIVPLESQIPDCSYQQIIASHATSMRKSCKFVRTLIE